MVRSAFGFALLLVAAFAAAETVGAADMTSDPVAGLASLAGVGPLVKEHLSSLSSDNIAHLTKSLLGTDALQLLPAVNGVSEGLADVHPSTHALVDLVNSMDVGEEKHSEKKEESNSEVKLIVQVLDDLLKKLNETDFEGKAELRSVCVSHEEEIRELHTEIKEHKENMTITTTTIEKKITYRKELLAMIQKVMCGLFPCAKECDPEPDCGKKVLAQKTTVAPTTPAPTTPAPTSAAPTTEAAKETTEAPKETTEAAKETTAAETTEAAKETTAAETTEAAKETTEAAKEETTEAPKETTAAETTEAAKETTEAAKETTAAATEAAPETTEESKATVPEETTVAPTTEAPTTEAATTESEEEQKKDDKISQGEHDDDSLSGDDEVKKAEKKDKEMLEKMKEKEKEKKQKPGRNIRPLVGPIRLMVPLVDPTSVCQKGETPACPGTSCLDILTSQYCQTSNSTCGDGIYFVDPTGRHPKNRMFCDMTEYGGGWTLALSLADGAVAPTLIKDWPNKPELNPAFDAVKKTGMYKGPLIHFKEAREELGDINVFSGKSLSVHDLEVIRVQYASKSRDRSSDGWKDRPACTPAYNIPGTASLDHCCRSTHGIECDGAYSDDQIGWAINPRGFKCSAGTGGGKPKTRDNLCQGGARLWFR